MQIVDLAKLSLVEFCEKAHWYSPVPTGSRARRDVTDALRTVYWYNGVQQAAQVFSARGLERRFEPEAFWVSGDHERQRRNKWGKYRMGQHVPFETNVAKVDVEFPSLRRDLNHPLWQILAWREASTFKYKDFLPLLDWNIQQVLLTRGAFDQPLRKRAASIDRRLANALERRASLDALAAIVLLIHQTYATRQMAHMHEWIGRMYRMLVILGYHLLTRNIARPLFELIVKRVFVETEYSGISHYLPASRYIETIGAVLDAMYHLKDLRYEEMSELEKTRNRQLIVNGKFGWDHKCAFNPIRILIGDMNLCTADDRKIVQRDINLYKWAWNMLHSGGHRDFPPEEAINGNNLWARNRDESNHDNKTKLGTI